jgi:inhibitor of cysteine peptidase
MPQLAMGISLDARIKLRGHSLKELVAVKKAPIMGIILVFVLPVLVLGCQREETTASTTPPSNGEPKVVQLEISNDEFMSEKNIVKDVEIIKPGSLSISLGSNPTTGFEWTETALISDPAVIKQESHAFIPPPTGGLTPMVGVSGKETWSFSSLKAGKATISLSYSRPWEGGEKNVKTLNVNVSVK